jgi:hypothetical protein
VLKIATIEMEARRGTVQLEGQIIGPWVDELQRTCDRLLLIGPIALDLAHVSFVERRGVDLLRSLGAQGVPLLHCSPFVTEQLRMQA